MVELSLVATFLAGVVSFLSPCVLPLVPAFLAYLSGVSLKQNKRLTVFLNALAYVLGFSLVFASLGVLLNTVLSNVSYMIQSWLSRIAGLIIILFGLYLVGLIKLHFLEREHTLKISKFINHEQL